MSVISVTCLVPLMDCTRAALVPEPRSPPPSFGLLRLNEQCIAGQEFVQDALCLLDHREISVASSAPAEIKTELESLGNSTAGIPSLPTLRKLLLQL